MRIRIWDLKNSIGIWIRIEIHTYVYADPDPGTRGYLNIKEEKIFQQIFNYNFQMTLKNH